MVPCQDFWLFKDNFTLEAFTEIDVLVDVAIALDYYSDAYEDAVDEVTQKIKRYCRGSMRNTIYAEVVREEHRMR